MATFAAGLREAQPAGADGSTASRVDSRKDGAEDPHGQPWRSSRTRGRHYRRCCCCPGSAVLAIFQVLRATASLDLLDLVKQKPVSLDTTHSLPLPATLAAAALSYSRGELVVR